MACCVAWAVWAAPLAAGAEEADDYEIGTRYEGLTSWFHPVTETFFWAGRFEFDIEAEVDFDLGGDDDHENEVKAEPKGSLSLAWQPSDTFWVVGGLELRQRFILEPSEDENPDPSLSLTRAYAVARDLFPNTVVVAGRQNFVDERKWIWEEPLDGLRVIWSEGPWALDFAAARDQLANRDLLDRRDTKGGSYFWASGRYAITEDAEGSVYALYIDDREDEDADVGYLGVHSHGEALDNVNHWLEAAVVAGEEEDRDVLGFGFDAGATWQSDLALDPAFTLGVAFGSGDDGEGKDTAFRQTGLQENSDKFAGEASFDYYGQVLDPELSNLLIVTAGAGIRPVPDVSVDLIYHHYRLARKTDELRDAALDADPNGESHYLGDGLDLVVGWEVSRRLSLEAVGGIFFPGSAFDEDDPAYFAGAEMVFRF